MADAPDREPGLLARRLERLFATAHPPARGPYTITEAVAGINEAAGASVISYNYLYQLRRGTKTEPSHSRLAAIARFFGVPVTYFTDDEETAADIEDQLEAGKIATALQDAGVRNIAFRAAGLSAESLAAILAMIENVRRLEGLPDGDDDPAPPSP
jgi:transcriptional regulator with XRE-family HTH domain